MLFKHKNYIIWMIFKPWTIMLFEWILNKTFILFVWFSKHEQLCYLNKFSINHWSYLNDFQNMNEICYLNEFTKNYLIWTILKTWAKYVVLKIFQNINFTLYERFLIKTFIQLNDFSKYKHCYVIDAHKYRGLLKSSLGSIT